MISFIFALVIVSSLIFYWYWQRKSHQTRIDNIPLRIHVNGIRGKSTVTRLIAGILREAGYKTVAKTTGSAARIIHEDGSESPISRWGAPTILEQMQIIKDHVPPATEALVIECMAVNPVYQHITQHQIVRGNVVVITNVREDHQDVMGESLLEIADSLSNTIPDGGILITGETRPELNGRLHENAIAHNSQFICASADSVPDSALEGFSYLAFKENVAIGLQVAQMLNIPQEAALRGMQNAAPDVGAVHIQRRWVHGKELVWGPLFAVNDRESTIVSVEALRKYHRPEATRIGILNNRLDRAVRAMQFAEIAAQDLQLDYFITFGAYEAQVADRMATLGYSRERIIHLGDSRRPTTDEILKQVTDLIVGEQGMLIGMVNMHTAQAEQLARYFEGERLAINGRVSLLPGNRAANSTVYA